MKSGFDINRITGDGYLILPLSMAKLAQGFGQDPKQCYEIIDYFTSKLEILSNDVVFLYTTGLYLNTIDVAYEKRVKLNQQAIQHARELRSLINRDRKYVMKAFHFLPIDYVILNSEFSTYFSTLKQQAESDEKFQSCIEQDSGDREFNGAQENFILEEIVVSHILRQQLCPLPRTLVTTDSWRLICYPGSEIQADKYQHQHNLLPKHSKNPYSSGVYNFETKQYINFDEQ